MFGTDSIFRDAVPFWAVLACLLSALPAGAAGTVKIGETAYASIEAAYEDAADNAVIVIHTDADGLRLTSDRLTIAKPVTLRGDGATAAETIILPKNEASSGDAMLVDLNHADAAIENLTLAGGRNGTSSGESPVRIHDGTVSNCVVRDCSGTGTFGAVTLFGGVLRDSVVRNNTFTWKSNSWLNYGGGVSLYMSGTPLVTNCVIACNKTTRCGGGVWLGWKDAKVVDCVITNNSMTSNGYGGGVFVDSGTIEDCLISGNGATSDGSYGGSAVALGNTPWSSYSSGNPAIMRRCLIVENVVGSTASSYGGVVHMDQSKARLEQCTIVANTTAKVLPAALYQSAGTVASCLFALNSDCYGRITSATTFKRTGGTLTNCVSDVEIPAGGTTNDNQVGRIRFVDAPNGDYHLAPGCVAGHAGRYPYDPGALAVAVCYDNLIHDRTEPIDFSLILDGTDQASLTYKWDFNGDGTVDATTASPTWENPSWGTHRVQVIVENGSGNVATGLSERVVEVLPHTTYVSKTGTPEWPYDNTDNAARTVEPALAAVGASLAQPGTVRIATGEYDVSNAWIYLTTPVRLVGEGPEETLLKAYNNGASSRGVLNVNHPDASVSGLTMWNGNSISPAGLMLVSGLITNCVIRDCNGTSMAGGVEILGGSLLDSQIFRCQALATWNYGLGFGGGLTMSAGLVENCVISNNMAYGRSDKAAGTGGGVCQCGGIVRCCRILNNKTYGDGATDTTFRGGGGALLAGSALMERCEIAGNWATAGGGVLLRAGKVLDVSRSGSGILRNCFVHGNTAAKWGGGIRVDSGTVEHCTVVENDSTTRQGGGIYQNGGTVRNTIVYENGDIEQDPLANFSFVSGTFDYNVYTPQTNATGIGEHNLTGTPGFADAPNGDYSLAIGSIAIDSGYDAGTTTNDYVGAKRPMKGNEASAEAVHDRGAWEAMGIEDGDFRLSIEHTTPVAGFEEVDVTYTAQVAGQGMKDKIDYVWTHPGGTIVSTSEEGDSVTVHYATHGKFAIYLEATNKYDAVANARIENLVTVAPTTVYVSKDGSHEWPYDTWAKASTNIQTALDTYMSVAGETSEFLVGDGDYTIPEARITIVQTIALRSQNGPERTTLRPGKGSIVYMEHDAAVLDGFTLTGVNYKKYGGTALELVRGTAQNCIVTGNSSGSEGCVRITNGTLRDCRVVGNEATQSDNSTFGYGGGIYVCGNATISGCEVSGNTAGRVGGGIYVGSTLYTGVVITNCVVACNTNALWESWSGTGGWNGSGIYALAGLITHCVVTGNYCQAYKSSGFISGTLMTGEAAVYVGGSTKLVNSLVAHNLSGWGAQGVLMDNASAEVRNCTIVDNGLDGYAYKDSANAWSSKFTKGKLSNTIVWGDHGGVVLSNDAAVVTSHNWTADDDPKFKNRALGNWRLKASSPCFNAGDNAAWGDALSTSTDLDGGPRLLHKTVDIGCYERLFKGMAVLYR